MEFSNVYFHLEIKSIKSLNGIIRVDSFSVFVDSEETDAMELREFRNEHDYESEEIDKKMSWVILGVKARQQKSNKKKGVIKKNGYKFTSMLIAYKTIGTVVRNFLVAVN